MNKFFAGLVIAIGLAFMPVAAHAQYTNPDESTCNMTYGNGGLTKVPQTMVINVYPHYNTTGTLQDVQNFKDVSVASINAKLQEIAPGTGLSFTQTVDEQNFNIKVNFSLYQTSDGYSVYVEVRGEGLGHLFRFNRSGTDVGDTVAGAVLELPTYFQNGWTCEKQN